MAFSMQQLQYYLTTFRTHKAYLIFQICQLILSIVIITTALISPHLFRQPLVLVLELVLLICMAVDLYVFGVILFFVRLVSEGSLWQKKRNKIDVGIFIVFLFTFGFMCLTESSTKAGGQSQYQQLIQGDDIIIIAIIVCRYMIQIYQIVNEIQETQHNMDCQKDIQNYDLNKAPYTSVMDDNNDVLQDEIIREKIKAKGSRSPEKGTKIVVQNN